MEARENVTTNVGWDQVQPKLQDHVINILHAKKFLKLTPVQVHTLPLFLSHKDVCVQACTGSGKTLAFVVPVIEILLRVLSNGTKFSPSQAAAMIITPTRELATQIKEAVDWFAEEFEMESLLFIGGTTIQEDQQSISEYNSKQKKALIIIGTPGKIEASVYNSPNPVFGTRQLEILVMDEADRLLELGFEASLNKILAKLPKQRRTGLFSATQTKELTQLIRAGLRNPVLVNVTVTVNENEQKNQQVIPVSLNNYYTICPVREKVIQLVNLLKTKSKEKVICYFLTCAQVNYFWKVLSSLEMLKDCQIYSLHGKVPQEQRKNIYQSFISKPHGILFTTDVAARGLDFPDLDLVIQFDPPQQPDQFVHRIGRTARMGKVGTAIVYLTPDQDSYIEFLRRRSIPIEELPPCENPVDPTPLIIEQNKKERENFDKAALAFVSFVRAYKVHTCSYIFRIQTLDFGNLANSFGLLVLPKMPELNNHSTTMNFNQINVNIDDIPYKDKQREKSRLKKAAELKKKQEQRENRVKPVKVIKKSEAWSSKKRIKAVKGGFEVLSSKDADENTNDWEDDWQELLNEKKLRKKLRKKQITAKEYMERVQDTDDLSDLKQLAAELPTAAKQTPK